MNTTMPWLDIDENVTVVNNLYHERLQFWDALPLHEYDAERRNNKWYDIQRIYVDWFK